MIYYKFKRLEPIYYFCEIDYVHKTEKWLPMVGYEGIYEISDLGRIKRLRKRKENKSLIRTQFMSTTGYLTLTVSKSCAVERKHTHQMVAEAFLNHVRCGYAKIVNHKNFIRHDCKLINLQIVTSRENTNQKHMKSSSQYTGVSWHKECRKWSAHIHIERKKRYLGIFINEYDAHLAYEKALSDHLKKQNRSN